MKEQQFYYAFDFKKATTITLFEKFCLFFVKKRVQVDGNNIFISKVFKGKLFLLKHYVK